MTLVGVVSRKEVTLTFRVSCCCQHGRCGLLKSERFVDEGILGIVMTAVNVYEGE